MVFSPGARRCCKKGETREGRNKLRTSLLYCSGKFKQSKYSLGNFSMNFLVVIPHSHLRTLGFHFSNVGHSTVYSTYISVHKCKKSYKTIS